MYFFFYFHMICTDCTSLMTPGNYLLGNLLLYTGKYLPPFYFRPFRPRPGKFKTGQIPLSQIIFLLTQLHMGEFKLGQSRLQV